MKIPPLLLLSAFWLGGPAGSPAGEETTLSSAGPLPELMQPCDLDGDGKLSVEERQAYDDSVKAAGQPKVINRPFLWDTDGNGLISPEERQAAAEIIKQKIEASRVARFDELDKNEDGKLSAAEFLNVPNLKPKVAARILNHLDTDHDGFISKAEFLAALAQAPTLTPVKNTLSAASGIPASATGTAVPATSSGTGGVPASATATTPVTALPSGSSCPGKGATQPATPVPVKPG